VPLPSSLVVTKGPKRRFCTSAGRPGPLSPDVGEIGYDEGQISQVIMNLMNNSRDAMKNQDSKFIIIHLQEVSDGVYTHIGDNGPGLPAEVQKRLFEPFVTTKEEGKGTGLGLSVCHGIIKNHGGEITVTTKTGEGTAWHIFLPK